MIDEFTFKQQNPEFEHCIKFEKPTRNLQFIAEVSSVLQSRLSLRINRNYKTYSDSTHHYYYFKKYEHSKFLEEWFVEREKRYQQ